MKTDTSCIRGFSGKIICLWSPLLHGEGCSTAACAIGFALQYYTGKRVLIVNKSNNRSQLEEYFRSDIEIKYSLDNLKIFNTGIRTEHILTYATQVNPDLYVIAGSRLAKEICGDRNDFDKLFIDRCLKGFDFVIVDIDSGVKDENRVYLERAEKIVSIITPNEIVLDKLCHSSDFKAETDYFYDKRTVQILNKLHEDWDDGKIRARIRKRCSLSEVFGLNYDGGVLRACCFDRDFYSFIIKEIKRGKNVYAIQLKSICEYLMGELIAEPDESETPLQENAFKRFLRSSLF